MNEETFFKYQVPKKYFGASLDRCEQHPNQYIKFAKEWAKNPTSVFLFGGYGTGKTYFAFAMIREMFRSCQRLIWPRYFTSPDLDSLLLRDLKSDEGDQWRLKDLGEQDLLFIDDLGRETKSERLKRQYFEILNFRYANEKPTLLTSNYTLEDLSEIFDGAVASRMQEWTVLEFNGPDLRASISNENTPRFADLGVISMDTA